MRSKESKTYKILIWLVPGFSGICNYLLLVYCPFLSSLITSVFPEQTVPVQILIYGLLTQALLKFLVEIVFSANQKLVIVFLRSGAKVTEFPLDSTDTFSVTDELSNQAQHFIKKDFIRSQVI